MIKVKLLMTEIKITKVKHSESQRLMTMKVEILMNKMKIITMTVKYNENETLTMINDDNDVIYNEGEV